MNDKDKEEFDKWFISCRDSSFAVFLRENYPDVGIKWDREPARSAWQAACEYKQKEIDELKLEYDKLTDWASEYVARNRKLKECVKWYADPKNCDNIDFTHCEWCERTEEEIADAGFRARQCLKELEEK